MAQALVNRPTAAWRCRRVGSSRRSQWNPDILLDTNIVSEASKPQPSAAVADWVQEQPDDDLFISTLTIAEIWRGVLEMTSSRRRRDLEAWFAGAGGPSALLSGRALSFDERAAMEWARIMGGDRRRPPA